MSALLEVKNLCVDYITDQGSVRAANNVSFSIQPGEVFGLAGESGCGKSTVAFAVPRLHNPPALISSGEILFEGENILHFNQQQLQAYRWAKVSMVFQSAMNSLNPVLRVEKQFADMLMAHGYESMKACRARTGELLDMVGIHPSRMRDYPHQFSGGMRQRIVIAIALALRPKLMIMDEPTTALDVVVQREILQQINDLQRELGFSVLFITHDLSLMAEFADRLGVMYAGQLVEVRPSQELLRQPIHPYSHGLTQSFPSIRGPIQKLTGIPGNPLDLTKVPDGCRFAERCFKATDLCREQEPQLIPHATGHVACHHPISIAQQEMSHE